MKIFLSALFLLIANSAAIADVAGLSDEEALRLGEAMYVKGVLPSGRPMQAVVHGDIKVTGSMVTCSSCHMRSGLGGFEGMVLTPPATGVKLYAPLDNPQDFPGSARNRSIFKNKRPAYTDKNLALALRSGVDPTGRVINAAMPRYLLDDKEMEILIFYLKNLSSQYSAGVTSDGIRFAVVVTEGVSERDRNALIEPLKAFVREEWNARLSLALSSRFYRDDAYRPISLDVWELKGPAETWGTQLDALYRRQPVFALLGGVSSGPWDPIHAFCEKNRIPCVLPVTDLPVISGSDRYTVYFSKGYYQEGEAAAKYLGRVVDLPDDRRIVQVYREGEKGNAFAKGFMDSWKKIGKQPLSNRVLSAGEAADGNFWKGLAATYPNAVMLIWLDPEDLAGLDGLAGLPKGPSMIFVSSTMSGGALSSVPDAVRDVTFITWPHRLPEEREPTSSTVERWLNIKKIQKTNPEIASKVFFLTRTVSRALTEMRGEFYRDYFLDLIDGQGDRSEMFASCPRISFAPRQRYASNGCYIVTLTKEAQPKVVRKSDWIIY